MISQPPSYAPGPSVAARRRPQNSVATDWEGSRRHGGLGGLPPLPLRPVPPPPSLCYLSPASSCSLQRFNAIPCKFVCGQVYMVPGLSVSSIYPRSSSLRPACRLPSAAPLQSTAIIRLVRPSPPWVNIAKSVSHTSDCICARVSLSQSAYIQNVYTRCPKSRVLAAVHELLGCCYPISNH